MKKNINGDPSSTLSLVNEFCSGLPDSVFFIAGDMNARTGSNNAVTGRENLVLQDLFSSNLTNDHQSLSAGKRNSKDTNTNERGNKLLDFGCEWNLTIVNGSVLGDTLGDWTCYRYNGSSVVDYMMVSHTLKEAINYLKVLDLTEYSDHRPLLCSIGTSCPFDTSRTAASNFEDKPLGHKWENQQNESKIKFLNAQQQESITTKITKLCSNNCENSNEVYRLNDELINIFRDIANTSLQRRRRPRVSRRVNKKVWFDEECRNVKRLLAKLTRRYPENDKARDDFYQTKRYYRSILKYKKRHYFANLNKDIEEANQINWRNLQKLKEAKCDPDQLDLHDLQNFYEFFKKLYSESPDHINIPPTPEQTDPSLSELSEEILNRDIDIDELNKAISKLKAGKAVGEDCVPNEFLRCSNVGLRLSILHLFNQSLANGVYPWNTSIVTPLHKKGDRANPDNYRAIAVSSSIGKLFSNILLERLISYRNIACPDPSKQLGFCKEAKTADHIFTLTTCINKYLGLKQRVYSCFIDFRKAFDSVSREALIYKLSILGIQGRFIDCMRHMYSHSRAKIKLLGKLSQALDVSVGTEQGHPMSPELFTIFLLGLSEDLNNCAGAIVPKLNGVNISHLLWADDLVLLATDSPSLQILIDTVHNFCTRWGLTVNISKTAILILNTSGRKLKESTGFTYGDTNIPSDNKYCYLGITLTLSGSLTLNMDNLRKKGLRAYFSLRNLVDIKALSVHALLKLFDALILPVISYGSQIWFHKTAFMTQVLNQNMENKPHEALKKIATDPIERLHLKFLKWTLGVHEKTSNIFCWGDTGRSPLLQRLSKQTVDYFKRLENFSRSNIDNLTRHAFEEQKNLNLPWFQRISELITLSTNMPPCYSHSNLSSRNLQSGASVKIHLLQVFNRAWSHAASESSKLQFYQQLKIGDPSFEPYLNISNRDIRRSVAQLRSRSHRLHIETSRHQQVKERYQKLNSGSHNLAWLKCCRTCCDENLADLLQLPFSADPIVEDERHVLVTCPAYHHLRSVTSEHILSVLLAWDERLPSIFDSPYINELSLLIHKIFQTRFPNTKTV
ncbi:hypothetical protein ACHWQZ_G002057 [Mnemiopsis leidyi]